MAGVISKLKNTFCHHSQEFAQGVMRRNTDHFIPIMHSCISFSFGDISFIHCSSSSSHLLLLFLLLFLLLLLLLLALPLLTPQSSSRPTPHSLLHLTPPHSSHLLLLLPPLFLTLPPSLILLLVLFRGREHGEEPNEVRVRHHPKCHPRVGAQVEIESKV